MPFYPEVVFGEAPILVTGASSGIGAAIALRLNSFGARVIASGRNASRLDETRGRAAFPDMFYPEQKDLLSNLAELDKWVAELAGRYGKMGGLAFAAGTTQTIPFLQYEYATGLKMFDLLLHAPIMVARGVAQRKNCVPDGLSMVFIAAAAATSPNKGQMVYAAAKAALVRAAHCMAKELASRSARVNCISPGLVKTPMLDATVELLGESFVTREESLYPLGLGEPEDVANMAAFLLSPAARWITAQNIVVDGGRLA